MKNFAARLADRHLPRQTCNPFRRLVKRGDPPIGVHSEHTIGNVVENHSPVHGGLGAPEDLNTAHHVIFIIQQGRSADRGADPGAIGVGNENRLVFHRLF